MREVLVLLSVCHMGAMAPSLHRQAGAEDTAGQPTVAAADSSLQGSADPRGGQPHCRSSLASQIDRCLARFEQQWAAANGGRSITGSSSSSQAGSQHSWTINGQICW